MVRRNRAHKSAFLVGILFFSILSLEACLFAGGERIGQLESEDSEMGAKQSGTGTTWNAADKALKHQFELAYESGIDTRLVFERHLDTLGAEAMLDFLELRNPRCHGEAHDLGQAIAAYTKDLGTALNLCGNRCTNACMHGVVSEVFGDREYDDVTKHMTGFCERGDMAALHKPGNCAHGIGHGLMILTGHDIEKSLAGCAAFPKAGMDYYCATGVFMEYRGMLRNKETQGEEVPRPSLHFPCDTYPQFPAACYRYMLRRIARELDVDNQRLIDECLGLTGRQQHGCFHGLGAMYSRDVAKRPSLLPDLCLRGDPEDQILCIEGVIEKMADFDEDQALAVCAILTGENAKVCTAGAQEKMYRLHKPTMKLYRGNGAS